MGDPEIGSTLGGYRLDEVIGRGGMGVVYRARQLGLDRDVALKVIARHLSGDQGFRERFLRESRLAARLDHPAVVPVFDAREEDGELIVAMRLVSGGDLGRQICRDGPLPADRALDLLDQVADALDAAHEEGIVHRDVKPHNILLEGGRAFLTDFGLAKAVGESGAALGSASIVGTVEYMSPEQWRGREVGPAADVYSLGCVLYETLTGVAPFARRAQESEPEMPAGLDAVIERAVDKDPARRYPTAGELIEAARERQGADLAPTAVLSEEAAERPTTRLGRRGGGEGGEARRSRRRALGWLATPAILIAFIAALVLLLGDDEVSVSDPVAVGSGALRLAADGTSVWAISGADGTLARIDPQTGRIRSSFPLDRGISAVALGAGHVWVSSPRRHDLLRIDPDERSTLRIPVGGRPGAIVVSGGRVWVADQRGGGVSAVNPGGRVFKRGIGPRAAPLRLTAGAGAVWASSASTGTVRRIDRGSATVGRPIRVGPGPAGVTVGGGLVWVAKSRSNSVTRVDPATGLPLGSTEVGDRPGGVDAGTNFLWVANNGDDTVSRIEIESGEVIGDPIEVGPRPGAVAVGREAVWVANNGDGTLSRIEP